MDLNINQISEAWEKSNSREFSQSSLLNSMKNGQFQLSMKSNSSKSNNSDIQVNSNKMHKRAFSTDNGRKRVTFDIFKNSFSREENSQEEPSCEQSQLVRKKTKHAKSRSLSHIEDSNVSQMSADSLERTNNSKNGSYIDWAEAHQSKNKLT
jgi:hypothetical protein